MSPTATRVRLPDGSTVHAVNRGEAEYLYREIFVERGYVPDGGFGLPPHPVVFDVGANIGLFTLFAHREWDGPVVHAFEPVPALCDVLRRNTRGLRGVTVHGTAVGDRDHDTEIGYYPRFTMMSGLHADADRDRELARACIRNAAAKDGGAAGDLGDRGIDELLDDRLDRESVPCRVRTLDTVLAGAAAVDRIDLLKVDVECSELAVLRGIGAANWPRIGNAVVEVTDQDGRLAAVCGLLEQHGLHVRAGQPPDFRGTAVHLVHARRSG